jgi:diguanylate cyclase
MRPHEDPGLQAAASGFGSLTEPADLPGLLGSGAGELPNVSPVLASRIVLVDDEPLNSEALTHFLMAAGYLRVTTLPGSGARVDLLREQQPDVIVLDMDLDDGRAMEVLAGVRNDRILRHVPVLALSSTGLHTQRLAALQAGALDYMVKPVDGIELQSRLHNILATKLHRDELAHTDALTGLPNREALLWRLDWAIKHAVRHHQAGAMLQIGLDRFDQLNDALGPAATDELLHAVSQRLVKHLREGDIVSRKSASADGMLLARGSGAEFAVLLPLVAQPEDAALVAKRLVARLAEPFDLSGHEVVVHARVGIAVFPADSAEKDTIVKQAGVAMRHARNEHVATGAEFQFYSESLNTQSLRRLGLERELRLALERGEFRVYLQPQVRFEDDSLCGAEALVRWQHPERGLVGPFEFITLMERAGLIGKLGRWMMDASVRQLAAWRKQGLHLPQVSVNVSSLQLQSPHFGDEVAEVLRNHGVEGPALCLEITESAVLDCGSHVTNTLARLREIGVQLALDDFGTGYSSLTSLLQLSIDELKMDRSFVSRCHADAKVAAITEGILLMARRLKVKVMAEGVETQEERSFLHNRGADAFQGYFFAKPMPLDDFELLLRKRMRASSQVAA